MFLPWLNGSLAPVASGSIRGGFVNMSLDTERADLVRAVVEGVAHNLAWLLPHVEAFTGEPIRRDRVRGRRGPLRSSGARCSPTCSTAPCRRSPAPRAARRGRWACSRSSATERCRPPTSTAPADTTSRTFEPDPTRHERYAYRQTQFEAAYNALLPISEALSS